MGRKGKRAKLQAYPRVGMVRPVTRGRHEGMTRCINPGCEAEIRKGQPYYRVDIERSHMRGDDAVAEVCRQCGKGHNGKLDADLLLVAMADAQQEATKTREVVTV